MISTSFQVASKGDTRITESFAWIGLLLTARGDTASAEKYFEQAIIRLNEGSDTSPLRSAIHGHLAQAFIWQREYDAAKNKADRAWSLSQSQKQKRQLIRAARLQGEANLMLENLDVAMERLQYALSMARSVDFIEEEIPALTLLGDLQRRKGNYHAARDLLNQVWEPAEQGPYPLLHTDALNTLAQIERDENNREEAVMAATKAYQYAWCDSPPYAYHQGLQIALGHLEALNEAIPVPTNNLIR